MARADADSPASRSQPLLRQLREIKGVRETQPGVFDAPRRSRSSHFHVEGGALHADLKKPGGSRLRPLPAGDAGRAAQARRRREAARAALDDE